MKDETFTAIGCGIGICMCGVMLMYAAGNSGFGFIFGFWVLLIGSIVIAMGSCFE